jgi:hypothetical protein
MGKIKGRQATQVALHNTAVSGSSPAIGMWEQEVAAAQTTRKREVIQAAASAGGGTTKAIRRRRLQLTVEAAQGERQQKPGARYSLRKTRAYRPHLPPHHQRSLTC